MVDTVGGANYSAGEAADSANLAWSGSNDVADFQDPSAADGSPSRAHAAAPADEADLDQSWTTAWTRAATVLLICLALAAVIVVAGWVMHQNRSSETATETARTTAATATTAAPPTTTVSSTADQDSRYITALNDKGIQFANPQAAVFNGKTVCQNIGQGMTVQEVVAQFKSSSPDFAVHAEDFVAISVRAYCPQYNKLVAAI
ncbi:DUF732 domain-containing protein [Mycobacterium camsae]|uniref:DUF732 domain-containing protein n=1 Tax=Mycobacterium gordonae TaxID=1778 RepID=UPI00197D3348|nr:DUF732 domain-containing protein [Mycobacterium gordonae]